MKNKDSALYRYRGRFKTVLMLIGAAIVLATVWYTGRIAAQIKEEERRKVELFAKALVAATQGPDEQSFGFILDVIKSNESIPQILVDDQGTIMEYNNLDSAQAVRDPRYLQRKLERMKERRQPITVPLDTDLNQYLYYSHSALYDRVRYFPALQLSLIGLFLTASYVLFSTSRRAEQNRVWVGMSKETAHQLGTPISSLVAWLEYLRETEAGAALQPQISEMEKDVNRLETIAERFSKVGSAPDLQRIEIGQSLVEAVEYIRRRTSSSKVSIRVSGQEEPHYAAINEPLFAWAIENLLKNALDAMEGSGQIELRLERRAALISIEVQDSGKGIPKNRWKRVFEPGYSTKKRGWGLGLTLTRRIVEEYHKGRIYIKDSSPGKGTTFRLELPAA
jgi:two-component system, sporulation sensor kinase D